MRARVANRGYGKMCDVSFCVSIVRTVYIIYSRHFPQLVIDVNACVRVWTSWVASVMDVAHWQPDAKQTPQLSPPHPPWWTEQVDTHIQDHTHTQSWFIHNVVQKCSFGSSRDSADVMGHGLCTNYVWDSCEWRGPCHRLPSKRGRRAESIHQHQQARSVQNRSRVCARNGLVVKKQHLWTKMDAV